jgi:hypothetical protein
MTTKTFFDGFRETSQRGIWPSFSTPYTIHGSNAFTRIVWQQTMILGFVQDRIHDKIQQMAISFAIP